MVSKLTYKIIFDTNIFWHNNEDKISKIFNSSLQEAVKFIKENSLGGNISLIIPEIVTQERLEQTMDQIKRMTDKIENSQKSLKDFGVKIPSKYYKKNYREKIEKLAKKILDENEIKIIKTPILNQKKIIERTLKKVKPFSGESDKGLKDTIVWLTILNDAKKNKNTNYILCTSNTKDFIFEELNQEFKKINNSNLTIVDDLKGLREFLDKELNLKLKLKEEYRIIENKIKEKTGDLIVQFNERLLNNYQESLLSTSYNIYFKPYIGIRDTITNYDQKDIIAYNFGNIDIQDINKIDDDVFEVRANLNVIERHKNEDNFYQRGIYSVGNNIIEERLYSINFTYNRLSDAINLSSLIIIR